MNLKRVIAIAILLVFIGYTIHAQIRPRFEEISREYQDSYHRFEVWHDRESGQEFTCVYSGVELGYSVSCFPTGRNWK